MTDPSVDREGDTETFGNVTVTHYFKTVEATPTVFARIEVRSAGSG